MMAARMRLRRLTVAMIAVTALAAVSITTLAVLDSISRNPEPQAESQVLSHTMFASEDWENLPSGPEPTPTNTTAPTATATPAPPPAATPHSHPTVAPPPAAVPQVQPIAAPQAVIQIDTAFSSQVLALVNAERANRGVPPLSSIGSLTQAARSYARTLLRLNTLGHDAGGTSTGGRVNAAGYTITGYLGEVLWASRGYLPPERVVADWLASAAHRDIILDGRYNETGVACAFRQGEMLDARCVMIVAER